MTREYNMVLEPESDLNGNRQLLEFIDNLDLQNVYIVYHHDKFGVDFLKVFLSKQDAKAYKRYYELSNYTNCEIKKMELE